MDKGQTNRFTKDEMDIIKNVFKDENNLFAVRDVLFGFSVENFSFTESTLVVLRKVFLPELNPDAPLGQQADMYFSLNIKEIPMPEIAELHIAARDIATEYLNAKLSVLGGNKVNTFSLLDLKGGKIEGHSRFTQMLAYMFLNSYIEGNVMQLKVLANQKELTEKEKAEQAKLNSAK